MSIYCVKKCLQGREEGKTEISNIMGGQGGGQCMK